MRSLHRIHRIDACAGEFKTHNSDHGVLRVHGPLRSNLNLSIRVKPTAAV